MTYKEIKRLVEEAEAEGKSLPLSGENENGESVIIEAGETEDGHRYFALSTIQDNDWVRVNEYYDDETITETYER